jgi:DNA-binding NarL/FixJ family response regulator
VVREGIEAMIRRQRDLAVVASAATGEEAVKLFRLHKPDVTLMDLELPAMTGLEAIQEIRRSDPLARIVILTVYSGDEDIYRGMQATLERDRSPWRSSASSGSGWGTHLSAIVKSPLWS